MPQPASVCIHFFRFIIYSPARDGVFIAGHSFRFASDIFKFYVSKLVGVAAKLISHAAGAAGEETSGKWCVQGIAQTGIA